MPWRTPDKREALGQKGRDYADAVVDFMNARGYLLEGRAEDTGEPEDMVFLPKAGNRTPVVVEAKHRDEDNGLSPNAYQTGFGERFREWECGSYEGYKFNFFISETSNPGLWKQLFKSTDEEAITEFYTEKVRNAAEGELAEFLDRHAPSRFKRFVENTYVWADYGRGDLIRIAERAKDSGDYDYNPYLESYEAVPEPGDLRTNLLEIRVLPETLYRIPALDGTQTRSFYRHKANRDQPVYYYEGSIYSLLAPDDLPDATTDFYRTTEADTLRFDRWASADPSPEQVDAAKALLRGLLTMHTTENRAVVTRERDDTRIYMHHEDTDETLDGKWLTQQLETSEVRHRAVVVRMHRFGGRYFYALAPKQEFTTDGRIPVSGERKKELAADFSEAKYPQNKRKLQTVDLWETILAPDESLLRFSLPAPLRELQLERVEGLTLEGVRPPSTPEERTELIEGSVEDAPDPNQSTFMEEKDDR